MLTQAAGWGVVPDYLAVFKPESYRWLVPALNNPTEMSQLSMTLGALLFVAIALCEVVPAIRRCAGLPWIASRTDGPGCCALFELWLMVCVGTVGSGLIAGVLRAGPMALP